MANQFTKLNKEIDNRIDEIKNLLDNGFSASEISKKLQYGYSSIYNAIKRNGLSYMISVEKNGKSRAKQEYIKSIQKFDYKTLYKEYVINGLNLYEIAAKYDMSASNVLIYTKKFGIKRRTKSEANRLLYEKRPELREVHRQNAYDRKTGIYNKNFNRRESKIEKMFEEYCTTNNIEYKKQFQINGKGHRYDFLIGTNTLVEVDGHYWHNTEKQKILDKHHEAVALLNGYDIIRFLDKDIKKTKGVCFEAVKRYV